MASRGPPPCPGCPYDRVCGELATEGQRTRWADRRGTQWDYGRRGCPWWHYCQKCHLTVWPYDFRTRNVPRQSDRQTTADSHTDRHTDFERQAEDQDSERDGVWVRPRTGVLADWLAGSLADWVAGGWQAGQQAGWLAGVRGLHKTTTRQLQDNYKTTHKTTHKTTPFSWQVCAFVILKNLIYFNYWTVPV